MKDFLKKNKKTIWGLFGFGVFYHFLGRGARGLKYNIVDMVIEGFRGDAVQVRCEFVCKNQLWASFLVRRLTGKIFIQENYVADVNTLINQKVMSGDTLRFPVRVSLPLERLGYSMWENIRVGDYRNLLVDFDGHVTVGDSQTVSIPFNEQITWSDVMG